ncbi:hypothetical protein NDU88_002622 [Pleurodeles waltl]|uniref:Uncharacterized protein n=1 Tax=Pleurodeles waltl TaxID=8319 RepID=A0AAV7WQS7_PLEWA|nr:hypothetical protein NDU88_002622 [Pleurodeles waltl]
MRGPEPRVLRSRQSELPQITQHVCDHGTAPNPQRKLKTPGTPVHGANRQVRRAEVGPYFFHLKSNTYPAMPCSHSISSPALIPDALLSQIPYPRSRSRYPALTPFPPRSHETTLSCHWEISSKRNAVSYLAPDKRLPVVGFDPLLKVNNDAL